MVILLIDGNNLLYRALSIAPFQRFKTSSGMFTGGVFGVLNSLFKYVRLFKPDEIYWVWDGKRSERRMQLYEDYKGQREYDKELLTKFNHQQQVSNKVLKHLGVKVICLKKEADDVIAKILSLKDFDKAYIVSTDKDYVQLVSSKVLLYSPIEDKIYSPDVVEKKFGVRPEYYVFLKALMGDPSDNIRGVAKYGKKVLKKLVKEGKSFEEIYDELLEKYGTDFETNMALIDFAREEFSDEEVKFLKDILDKEVNRNLDLVLHQLNALELRGLSKRLFKVWK